jgi:RNA polymerase sigma factor (sigma-70 family)
LPPRQRAALVLRFYEDLSERQIAEILRCRPGTVKSLVSRGLSRLRTQIGGEHE